MADSEASPGPTMTQSPTANLRAVAEIHAERTGLLQSETEVLVTFKAAWIPKTDFYADCPIVRLWEHATPKCKFNSAVGHLTLPLQPGTSLDEDFGYSSAVKDGTDAELREIAIISTAAAVKSDSAPSKSPSSASQSSSAYLWDVAEILAERRTLQGLREVLVAFKSAWIPKVDLMSQMAGSAIVRLYAATPKCTFVSSAGALIVPVHPGTSLARDVDIADAMIVGRRRRRPRHQVEHRDSNAVTHPRFTCVANVEDWMPEMSASSVASAGEVAE